MTVIPRSNNTPNLSAFLIGDGPAGFLLSWVAGFVDTSAFIILFGIFTAHVTGNIALAGSSFVSEDAETTITRLLMLPTFVLTVALTSLLAKYARSKQWSVFGVLLTAEAIALSIFLIVGTQLSPALLLDVQEEYILPIGISGVVAMAIQNALMKESKGVFKSYCLIELNMNFGLDLQTVLGLATIVGLVVLVRSIFKIFNIGLGLIITVIAIAIVLQYGFDLSPRELWYKFSHLLE